MKQYNNIFGIDVSKKTVDITHLFLDETEHRIFSNDPTGMEQLHEWLLELKASPNDTLFCMEATGLYCMTLTLFLTSNKYDTWVEQAIQIKRASGMTRGKSDKIDSFRIALYAKKNTDKIKLWTPVSSTLQKIKNFAALRDRLVDTKKRLRVPINEFEEMGDKTMAKLLTKSITKSLQAIDKDLKNVEAQMIIIIGEDENLKNLYNIVTSVVGIGFVTAVNLLVYTSGFTILKDVRKLACYCGVAPFEYSSGTSIKGRTKVHHMANKKLKCNLHMASLSAVKLDPDLKAYYERKVLEGKNKMSVLNAVRNKLLARIIACVDKNRMYVSKAA